jgi:hypothetical protein
MPVKIRGSFGSLIRPSNFETELDNHFNSKFQDKLNQEFQSKFDTAISNAEVGGGKILQVKNTLTSSRSSYTTNNNNVGTNISSLNTTITPSSTSSKVWVTITISFEVHHDSVLRLYRNSTIIGRNTGSTARWSGTFLPGYDADSNSTPRTNTYTYLDSPNTTSATTYKLNTLSANGSNHTFYLNRPISSSGGDNLEIATSSMTLMEVAG